MAKKQRKTVTNGKPRGRKMSHDAFIRQGIEKLRRGEDQGIHVVYSGFNEAFRQYFNGEDPRPHIDRLAAQGVITARPARGGATIALGDGKPHISSTAVLDKILGR